jgi:tetratricopeptide (TPR) repeat protein
MPRRLGIAALTLWPGLPQIWSGQEVLGLILAALFAATLNLALVTQFIWTELFAPGWPAFFACLAAMTWTSGLGYTLWWIWRCHPERHRSEIDHLYREATEHYLQGRWNEARRRFEQILAMDETDCDALMQLGTLFLRTEQPALARRAFRQCLELESGVKWRWEIGQALARLGEG